MVHYALRGLAVGVAISTAVFFYTVSPETLKQLKALPRWYLLPPFGLVVCSWMFNGGRLWLLCRSMGYSLGYPTALAISLSSEFGVAASPAGVGGAAIRLSLMKTAGIPLSTGTSLMVADFVTDLIFFSLVTPFSFFVFATDQGWIVWRGFMNVILLSLIPIVLSFCLLMIVLLSRGTLWRFARWVAALTPWGRQNRLGDRIEEVRCNIIVHFARVRSMTKFLVQRRQSALFANTILAAGHWCCRYGVLPLLLFGFSRMQNWFPLISIQGFLFAVSLLVVLPGGGGGIEIIMSLILQQFVPLSFVGIVLVLWRFYTFHVYLLVGGIVFCLFYNSREFLPSPPPSQDQAVAPLIQSGLQT
ncbi:MAG: flippase-like domain-containing protein [Deltaproteobacteria bacterium]|nr:flippase-like domain-containing protein [Deltaproteobacteria bacterium]